MDDVEPSEEEAQPPAEETIEDATVAASEEVEEEAETVCAWPIDYEVFANILAQQKSGEEPPDAPAEETGEDAEAAPATETKTEEAVAVCHCRFFSCIILWCD